MLRSLKLFVLSFIVAFSGCNFINDSDSSTSSREIERLNKGFNRALKITKESFPQKFVDHFPDKVISDYVYKGIYPNEHYKKNFYGTIIFLRVDSTKSQSIIDKLQFDEYVKFNYFDSCTFVLNENPINVNTQTSNCSCELYIIPDLKKQPEKHKKFEFDISDFDLYVIDSDSIQTLDDGFFSDDQNVPKCWRDGFSKGFGYSDKWKIEIFWIVFW